MCRHKITTVLVAVALVVSGELLLSARADAIFGGQIAEPGRWPWMAAVFMRTTGGVSSCGGTVIAPRRVLTARHCVTPDQREVIVDLTIIVGRSRLSVPGGQRLRVPASAIRRMPQHPLVPDRPGLDAAVILLDRAVNVPPVRLAGPEDAHAWASGTGAWVMGWGQIHPQVSPRGIRYVADRLRELMYPIVSDDACERVFGRTYLLLQHICAGTGNGDAGACRGDSGGPLVVADSTGWLQVGIVSGGDECAAAGYFDFYTRVDRVREFALGPQSRRSRTRHTDA